MSRRRSLAPRSPLCKPVSSHRPASFVARTNRPPPRLRAAPHVAALITEAQCVHHPRKPYPPALAEALQPPPDSHAICSHRGCLISSAWSACCYKPQVRSRLRNVERRVGGAQASCVTAAARRRCRQIAEAATGRDYPIAPEAVVQPPTSNATLLLLQRRRCLPMPRRPPTPCTPPRRRCRRRRTGVRWGRVTRPSCRWWVGWGMAECSLGLHWLQCRWRGGLRTGLAPHAAPCSPPARAPPRCLLPPLMHGVVLMRSSPARPCRCCRRTAHTRRCLVPPMLQRVVAIPLVVCLLALPPLLLHRAHLLLPPPLFANVPAGSRGHPADRLLPGLAREPGAAGSLLGPAVHGVARRW